jgi:CBS domain-containing protein
VTNPSSELDRIRVGDCMNPGILSCGAGTRLGEVADVMAHHRVHAVAVTDTDGTHPIGVVSALDVVAAAVSGEEPTALQAAATDHLSVSSGESLHRAGQLMAEYGVSHLIVLDESSGQPVGVPSTLDIASVYAQ